jgi:hypothetical protein
VGRRWAERAQAVRLRRTCAELVDRLAIPESLEVSTLIERLGNERGRPLRLRAVPLPRTTVGVLVSTEAEDVILVERGTSRIHQNAIAMHELGHLLVGPDGEPLASGLLTPPHSRDEDDVRAMSALLPSLDPQLIRSVLGRRYRYADGDPGARAEGAAELVATMILERAWRPSAQASSRARSAQSRRRACEGPRAPHGERLPAWTRTLLVLGACLSVMTLSFNAALALATAAGPTVQMLCMSAAGALPAAALITTRLAPKSVKAATAGLASDVVTWPARWRRWVQLHRTHRALKPLWSAMVEAVPAVRLGGLHDRRLAWSSSAVSLQVIRQLTEISDARLALRGWCDEELRARVCQRARSQGMSIGSARAAGEAAMLRSALRAYASGAKAAHPVRAGWPEEITHHRTLRTISTRTTVSDQLSEASSWYLAVADAFRPTMYPSGICFCSPMPVMWPVPARICA